MILGGVVASLLCLWVCWMVGGAFLDGSDRRDR